MSDRLKELQRHRAMLQEHLAWLDREIAALGGETKPSVLPPSEGVTPTAWPAPRPVAAPPPSPSPVISAAAAQLASEKAAEEILAQYQTDTQSVQTKTQLGCFMYFFAALAFVAVFVGIFYIRTLHKR